MQLKSKLIKPFYLAWGSNFIDATREAHVQSQGDYAILCFATKKCMSIATKRIAIDKGLQDCGK